LNAIGWTERTGETVGAHLFTFPAQETQGAPQPVAPELVARLYCHAVVSALPNEALAELVETLRDLESQFLKPTPQVTTPQSAPSKFSAKVGKSVPRPEIYIDAE
jgi:hypothetical protein